MMDPAFVAFFEGEFQRMLEAVIIPGSSGASWDRKAAYLLWRELRRVDTPAPVKPTSRSIFD